MMICIRIWWNRCSAGHLEWEIHMNWMKNVTRIEKKRSKKKIFPIFSFKEKKEFEKNW